MPGQIILLLSTGIVPQYKELLSASCNKLSAKAMESLSGYWFSGGGSDFFIVLLFCYLSPLVKLKHFLYDNLLKSPKPIEEKESTISELTDQRDLIQRNLMML